eukprot:1744841-Rhodomonas_salina.1
MSRLPISQKCPPSFSAASECTMKSPDRLFNTTSTGPYSSMLFRNASASLDDAIICTPIDRSPASARSGLRSAPRRLPPRAPALAVPDASSQAPPAHDAPS